MARCVCFLVCFLFSRQTKKWIVLSRILELVLSAPSSVNFPSLSSHLSLGVWQKVTRCSLSLRWCPPKCVFCACLSCNGRKIKPVFFCAVDGNYWHRIAIFITLHFAGQSGGSWNGFILQVRFIYGFSDCLHSHKCSFFNSVINNLCFTACLWVRLQQ